MVRSKLPIIAVVGAFTIALFTAGAVTAAPASARPPTTPPQAFGWVHNGASPRCLDSGIPANAQLWNCSGSTYQNWTLGYYGQLFGNSPVGCLDDGAGANGSGAYLTTCNGSSHQIWVQGANGSLVNAGSGRCLDADAGTIGQQGTRVQVWDCDGWAGQRWTFQYYEGVDF
jgi:hypothetical protein